MSESKESPKKVAYYEDDYTKTACLPETDRFPEVVFKYEPLNMIQSARLSDEILKDVKVTPAAEANMRMLGKHVISWNLKKPDGTVVNKDDVDELGRVDPAIINGVTAVIRGDKGTPERDIEEINESVKN